MGQGLISVFGDLLVEVLVSVADSFVGVKVFKVNIIDGLIIATHALVDDVEVRAMAMPVMTVRG